MQDKLVVKYKYNFSIQQKNIKFSVTIPIFCFWEPSTRTKTLKITKMNYSTSSPHEFLFTHFSFLKILVYWIVCCKLKKFRHSKKNVYHGWLGFLEYNINFLEFYFILTSKLSTFSVLILASPFQFWLQTNMIFASSSRLSGILSWKSHDLRGYINCWV